MSKSNIYANSDTIISSNLRDSNFSSLNYLAVGQSKNNYKYDDIIISLLKFDLSSIENQNNIIKAELYLYLNLESVGVENSNFNLRICRNRQDYNYKTVTWNTAPKTVNTGEIHSISGDNIDKYVKVDITDIVKKWLDGSYLNYGIALVANESSKLLFLSSSRGQNSPHLVVHYNKSIPYSINQTGDQALQGAIGPEVVQGIQGAQGIQELTGATESQGIQEGTGIVTTGNNAQFVTISAAGPIPIVDNDYIELCNVKIEGTDITHVNGSADVILQGAHTYYAFWNIGGSVSTASSIFQGVLELNGNEVQGSLGSSGTITKAQDNGIATGGAIFTTSAGSNTLKLKYMTYEGVTNAVCFASLSIIELS